MIRRRTSVSIETHEISIVKRRRMFIKAYCDRCGMDMGMITPSDAAALSSRNTEEIYQLMEANKIHYRYVAENTPYVCLTSLYLN